jgi:hypothetical protein
VALEFVGRDFDRPLTKEDQDWLLSWNQVDLLAEHAEKWGPDHDGSEKVEEEPPPPEPADDYDSWKFKELKAEADSRDPKVEYGTNPSAASLIEALRAWDVAHPEE